MVPLGCNVLVFQFDFLWLSSPYSNPRVPYSQINPLHVENVLYEFPLQ